MNWNWVADLHRMVDKCKNGTLTISPRLYNKFFYLKDAYSEHEEELTIEEAETLYDELKFIENYLKVSGGIRNER